VVLQTEAARQPRAGDAETQALQARLRSAQSALHAIETSTTWRLTEPLRRLGTQVKRFAGRRKRG
jgi:hypothetical protein